MHLRKQRSPALLKRFDQATRQYRGLLWLALILLAGCAGGSSGTSGIANFFRASTPTPNAPTTSIPTATPSPTPVAEEEGPAGHPTKKTAKQARAASENAAVASKEAANASAAAALASKQAASVANKISGSGPSNGDVSLEPNSGSMGAGEAATDPTISGATHSTPAARPIAPGTAVSVASVARTTPTLSSSALESSGRPLDETPARAAKMIADLDKVEKRVDRKNLNSDDSQRDILAQRLLQEAKKALADHDGVAALSLATKASTLLEPLPKIAESALPTAP